MLLFCVVLSFVCKFFFKFILILNGLLRGISYGFTRSYFNVLVAVAQANCNKSYHKMIKPKMCLVGELSTFEFKVKVNVFCLMF